MGVGFSYGKMDQGTMGSGWMIKMKDTEDSLESTVILMKGNLRTICNMGTESRNGWTEHHTTDNFTKRILREKEHINGATEEFTPGIG